MKIRPQHPPFGALALVGALLLLALFVVGCGGSDEAAPSTAVPAGNAQATDSGNGYPNSRLLVDAAWLAEHGDDPSVRIIDIRPPDAYAAGHVPGAVNIPVEAISSTIDDIPLEFDRDEVQAALNEAGLTPTMTAVIYDNLGMMDAARLFWTLEYVGHEDVRLVDGGWNAWQESGGDVADEAAAVEPTSYPIQLDADKIIDAQGVLDRLDDPGVVIVDARSPQEYSGEVRLAARGGHIPGAVNLVWLDALTGGDTVFTTDENWRAELQDDDVERFKTAAQLQTLLDEAGVSPDGETITYCQTLWRGAHVYFLLRLMGYDDVRGYDGSWAEWGNQTDLPVVTGTAPGSLAEAMTGPQDGAPSDGGMGGMGDGMATAPDSPDAPSDAERPSGKNVALQAEIVGVSSTFGGPDSDAWSAGNAIDGDLGTEWSSQGDGDDAWLEITLDDAYPISAIGLRTRTMGDTAQISQFQVRTGAGQLLGPFTLPDASGIYYFPVETEAQQLRFEVVDSSGGNTGLVELEIYTPDD